MRPSLKLVRTSKSPTTPTSKLVVITIAQSLEQDELVAWPRHPVHVHVCLVLFTENADAHLDVLEGLERHLVVQILCRRHSFGLMTTHPCNLLTRHMVYWAIVKWFPLWSLVHRPAIGFNGAGDFLHACPCLLTEL